MPKETFTFADTPVMVMNNILTELKAINKSIQNLSNVPKPDNSILESNLQELTKAVTKVSEAIDRID